MVLMDNGLPAAVHEGGHPPALRRDPGSDAGDLLAGEGGLGLQVVEGDGDGLDVGQRHRGRHLRRAEGPQQRGGLGRREGGVEGVDLAGALAGQQVDAGRRVVTSDDGP